MQTINNTGATPLANVPLNRSTKRSVSKEGMTRLTFRVVSFTVPKTYSSGFDSRSSAMQFGLTQGYGFKVEEVNQ